MRKKVDEVDEGDVTANAVWRCVYRYFSYQIMRSTNSRNSLLSVNVKLWPAFLTKATKSSLAGQATSSVEAKSCHTGTLRACAIFSSVSGDGNTFPFSQ